MPANLGELILRLAGCWDDRRLNRWIAAGLSGFTLITFIPLMDDPGAS
jgi:hypothetical protein